MIEGRVTCGGGENRPGKEFLSLDPTPCPQAPCFTPPSVGFLFPFALPFAACGGDDAVGRLAL